MSLPERAPRDQHESQTARLESPRTPIEPPAEAAFEGKSAYLVLFSQIGAMLLVANLGGALLGNWLDGLLGSGPILLVLGFLGGFAVGSIGAARTVRRALNMIDESERRRRERALEARVNEKSGRSEK
jgi:F0F1-type ATP synthase assembly protein I